MTDFSKKYKNNINTTFTNICTNTMNNVFNSLLVNFCLDTKIAN